MTKEQAAIKKGLKVYDVALPQTWLDEACLKLRLSGKTDNKNLYDTILSGTVWCYDRSLFGEPVALTNEAEKLLTLLVGLK